HAVITSAAIGSTVHDSPAEDGTRAAEVPAVHASSPLILGTSCSGEGSAAGTVDLNASGVADPSTTATVPVGGLSYKATYNGSTNHNSTTRNSNHLDTTKPATSTATDVHNAAHAVITSAAIGSTVHDSAKVTGTAAGGTPTGHVSFTLYQGTRRSRESTLSPYTTLFRSGVADPSTTATVPVGGLSYKATYNGS